MQMGNNHPEASCTIIDQYKILVLIRTLLWQLKLHKLGCHLSLTSPPGTKRNQWCRGRFGGALTLISIELCS